MSAALVMVNDTTSAQWTEFYAMHERLVHYGKVLLQGATGEQLGHNGDREPLKKAPWTALDEATAWATHQLATTLPARERIVLQVFYRSREAEYWHELDDEQQSEIETLLCREANYRMRQYCAEVQKLPVTIRGYHFRPIREAAVRELCDGADCCANATTSIQSIACPY